MAPAMDKLCPVIALVLETGGELPLSMKTRLIAFASETSPTFVDVAWAFM